MFFYRVLLSWIGQKRCNHTTHIYTCTHVQERICMCRGQVVELCIIYKNFFPTHTHFMDIFQICSHKSSVLFLLVGFPVLHCMDTPWCKSFSLTDIQILPSGLLLWKLHKGDLSAHEQARDSISIEQSEICTDVPDEIQPLMLIKNLSPIINLILLWTMC